MANNNLSAKGRKFVKAFGSPKGAGDKKNTNQYPIDTIERARAALSRVAQFGSPEEKARVRAAVAKKYPSISASK